jgi:radical SAM protein with 4Fe4S-binding SPASM domain
VSGYALRTTHLEKPLGGRLRRLDIELTERCDNDCIHCCINLPASDRAARARELSAPQIEDLLRQAADLGCLEVRFTGGEPLLRPDFEELYLFARRLGMGVLLFTHARRVTARLADLFARVPPRVPIEVTLYGMHAESYDAVSRVPGSYAQARRGVESLVDRGVPFVVKGAVLPPNRSEVAELEAWAGSLPWGRGVAGFSMTYDLRHRRDDETGDERIRSLRLTPEEAVAVLTRRPDEYREEMRRFSAFLGPPGDGLFTCGAGDIVCVDAYGRAQPCLGVRAPELTVPATSLAAALDSFERLRTMVASDPEYLRRCARCFLKGLCEQCPAKSWTEHGTLDTPVEYLCSVAHAQARWLGWLDEAESAWDVADWEKRVEGGDRCT